MFLNRIGKKPPEMAKKIINYFEKHTIFIDLFFGAGGLFFQKPSAKYNWLNDIDSEVVNLFQVVMKQEAALAAAIYNLPLHEELFNHWKTHQETEPVLKAVRFLMLSNFSLHGKSDTFQLLHSNVCVKERMQALLKPTQQRLENVVFRNKGFREFLTGISVGEAHIPIKKRLIYSDSPYLNTSNNYGENGKLLKWTTKDTEDHFEMLVKSEHRFYMSEFGHQLVLDLTKDYGLNVVSLGERRNIGNRREELLISNCKMVKEKYIQVNMFEAA